MVNENNNQQTIEVKQKIFEIEQMNQTKNTEIIYLKIKLDALYFYSKQNLNVLNN